MHLISDGKLKEASVSYPNVEEVIKNFAKQFERAEWQNLIDVQKDYQSAQAGASHLLICDHKLT